MQTPSPSEREPLSIQYLGQSGSTFPCVRAMVTILSSPYSCREITVVFREQPRGEADTDVCFIVWDWLGTEMTIVPDGCGTHSGTGGWGLGAVLALIQFYRIPLKEKWVESDQFERIVDGYPTERDCQELRQADFGAPSWPSTLREYEKRGHILWKDLPREISQFPYWMIEPELLNDVKDLSNPGLAVFQAARRLEMILRAFDPSFAERTGQELVNEAMREGRQFEPHGETASERQSWTHLFRGMVGAFRNPESHRDQQLRLEDAVGQIFTVNLLLRKLKADFPDQFRQSEHKNTDDKQS